MRLIHCCLIGVILGVTVAYPQSYLKVKSVEIDSNEHGQQSAAKSTNCSCGWTNKARIVGGRETLKNEFPLMAGLMELKERRVFCGASILTIHHAITASHCTYPNRGKALGLLVGGHDVSKSDDVSKIMEVEKTTEHEGYNPNNYHNDVAIVTTKNPIRFTQLIGPVCLPNSRMDLVNEIIKVIGWGRLVNKGKTSTVLMKVNLRVIPTKVCAKKYLRKIPTGENAFQICTYGRKKDSCQGDSGGPLIWLDPETNRYTLVATVSYGKTCASKTPAVNSEVAYFLPWIQLQIAKSGKPGVTCAKVD
uniref:Venom S1 protease 25 n=1 Tax=Ectomocoris sp. TaxID=3104572 RepID=A0AB38ZE94_9HEMI